MPAAPMLVLSPANRGAQSGGTRLVTRVRAWYDWRHPAAGLTAMLLMEFGDFAMLRRMPRGIKARGVAADLTSAPRRA